MQSRHDDRPSIKTEAGVSPGPDLGGIGVFANGSGAVPLLFLVDGERLDREIVFFSLLGALA